MKIEKKDIKLTKKDLKLLVLKGYQLDKIIRKMSNTSGAIFVPKRLIGQRFRVLLIPYDEIEELNIEW